MILVFLDCLRFNKLLELYHIERRFLTKMKAIQHIYISLSI